MPGDPHGRDPRANLWIGRLLESLGEILNPRHRNRVDGLLAVYSLLQTHQIRADNRELPADRGAGARGGRAEPTWTITGGPDHERRARGQVVLSPSWIGDRSAVNETTYSRDNLLDPELCAPRHQIAA